MRADELFAEHGPRAEVIAGERIPDERLRYVAAKPASVDDKVVSFACAAQRRGHNARKRGS